MCFSAFHPVSNRELSFTAGNNRTAVQSCHAARGHWKSTICTSVVYALYTNDVALLIVSSTRRATMDNRGKAARTCWMSRMFPYRSSSFFFLFTSVSTRLIYPQEANSLASVVENRASYKVSKRHTAGRAAAGTQLHLLLVVNRQYIHSIDMGGREFWKSFPKALYPT